MKADQLRRRAGFLVAAAAGWHVLSGASGWGSAFEVAFGELPTVAFGIAAAIALVLLTERPRTTGAATAVFAVGVIGATSSLYGLTKVVGGLLIVTTVLLAFLAVVGWQLLQAARVEASGKSSQSVRSD